MKHALPAMLRSFVNRLYNKNIRVLERRLKELTRQAMHEGESNENLKYFIS